MKKVLHIIENFNGQAIERWLFQIMRHLNDVGEKPNWSFYATLGKAGTMDDTVKQLGGIIIYSPFPLRQRWQFLTALRKEIAAGEYDVLHCHHDVLSAVYLLASAGLPFKKRIVHVHNTSLGLPTSSPLKNYLLHEPMRQACLHWADNIVGVSGAALDAFMKGGRRKKVRDMVIHCGIDLAPFHRKPPGRAEFLQSLGLPANSKILLFVGRMIEYKNPCFVIDVLARASRLDPTICAVFAGTGPLEEVVREKAEQNSLENRVRIMGWQEDIPALMQSCDMLIWPGLEEPKEGLGLGIVEAQAAGLPVLMSLSVPEEAIVVPELVEVLSLAAGVDAWADRILAVLGRRPTNKEDALAKLEASSFSISRSSADIIALYNL